jgi:hypothetical protein
LDEEAFMLTVRGQAGIAVAAAGGQIWGGTVKTVEELGVKLKEAVAAVESGRSAVLDCYIVGSGF